MRPPSLGGVPPSSVSVLVKGVTVSKKDRTAEQLAHRKSNRTGTREEPSALAGCECTSPDSRSILSSPLHYSGSLSADVKVANELAVPEAVTTTAGDVARKAHTRPCTAGSHS